MNKCVKHTYTCKKLEKHTVTTTYACHINVLLTILTSLKQEEEEEEKEEKCIPRAYKCRNNFMPLSAIR